MMAFVGIFETRVNLYAQSLHRGVYDVMVCAVVLLHQLIAEVS